MHAREHVRELAMTGDKPLCAAYKDYKQRQLTTKVPYKTALFRLPADQQ